MILEQHFFKNGDNQVFCIDVYERNVMSWREQVGIGWIAITKEEAMAIANPPPTPQELIEQAEFERQRRIAEANEFMNGKQWAGKAAIGRLKGDELARYNVWLDYLDELEALDVSTAADVDWPQKPE